MLPDGPVREEEPSARSAIVQGRSIRQFDDRDGRAAAIFGFCVYGLDQRV